MSRSKPTNEKLVAIINDVVSGIAKAEDAPCSASSHLDRALTGLLELCPEWKPWDDESREIVEFAKAHMGLYQCPLLMGDRPRNLWAKRVER